MAEQWLGCTEAAVVTAGECTEVTLAGGRRGIEYSGGGFGNQVLSHLIGNMNLLILL